MSFKFERLDVWQRSVAFADYMLSLTDGFPPRYQYSLGDQLRRAALSVPTNIAEGSGRDAPKESAYFYRIAKGSIYEVVSLLAVAQRHNLLDAKAYADQYHEANEIAAMLTSLVKSAVEKARLYLYLYLYLYLIKEVTWTVLMSFASSTPPCATGSNRRARR